MVKNPDHTKYMGNETYMRIYYEKIDYMGFTWGFIWGMGFYMGKPHVIKIYMVIYHTNLAFPQDGRELVGATGRG